MPGKYNATKLRTEIGVFDSTGEYNYWKKLQVLRKAERDRDRVVEVERQVPYPLTVNGHLIAIYKADFVVTYADGRQEVIDFKNPYLLGKGRSTPAGQIFQLKCKLMQAVHGLTVITVT